MAVRLKLGSYQPIEDDPLGRPYVGWFPRMTEQEAWEAGRGVWRMSRDRVTRNRFALIVAEGRVRVVAEITGITEHGDRHALQGRVLPDGHPLRAAYLDAPDPVETSPANQNPVGYVDLPEENAFRPRCGCGCGETTDRDYLPGHDVRAMQAFVRANFNGSVSAFLSWAHVVHPACPHLPKLLPGEDGLSIRVDGTELAVTVTGDRDIHLEVPGTGGAVLLDPLNQPQATELARALLAAAQHLTNQTPPMRVRPPTAVPPTSEPSGTVSGGLPEAVPGAMPSSVPAAPSEPEDDAAAEPV